MIRHVYYSHFRAIRWVVAMGVTVGMAMLLGFLILWATV